MNKEYNTELDQLIKDALKDAMEETKPDFAQAVMQKVELATNQQITAYKPPIGKKAWWCLGIGSVLFICYAIIGNVSPSSLLLEFNFEKWQFPTIHFPTINLPQFSMITTASVALLGMLLIIQFRILPKWMTKR